jgi:hypothetical protein
MCLGIVSAACFAGILSKHYRDNWPQFIGLCAILAWSLGRGWELGIRLVDWLASDPLMPAPYISAQQLLGHVGLAMFAIGTGWKVWRHRDTISNDGGFQRSELQ